MNKLVLLRHGQSVWNKENLFTGWTDVDLSEKGVVEAQSAGKLLKEQGYFFDVAYTSVLKRAIKTLNIALEILDQLWIPVYKSWCLNERHYGALQGLDKAETARLHGEGQLHIWRRSYDVRPPALDVDDKRHPGKDPRYAGLDRELIPACESLKDTEERFMPYWNETLQPAVEQGKRVLISAHGNSLRALVKHLDNISDEDIAGLNIPTGVPLVYEFDEHMKAIDRYYLGDPEEVARAAEAVANQGRG